MSNEMYQPQNKSITSNAGHNHRNSLTNVVNSAILYGVLGAATLLGGCSITYKRSIEGALEQKIYTETRGGEHLLVIRNKNDIPQFSLKPEQQVSVRLPNKDMPEQYMMILFECLEHEIVSRNDCYIKLNITGRKGQGITEWYNSTGADISSIELITPYDKLRNKFRRLWSKKEGKEAEPEVK